MTRNSRKDAQSLYRKETSIRLCARVPCFSNVFTFYWWATSAQDWIIKILIKAGAGILKRAADNGSRNEAAGIQKIKWAPKKQGGGDEGERKEYGCG